MEKLLLSADWHMISMILMSVVGTLTMVWGVRIAKVAFLGARLIFALGLRRGLMALCVCGLMSMGMGVGYDFFTLRTGYDTKVHEAMDAKSPDEARKAIQEAMGTLTERQNTPLARLLQEKENGDTKELLSKLENFHDSLTYKMSKDEEAFDQWKTLFNETFLGENLPNLSLGVYAPRGREYALLGLLSVLGLTGTTVASLRRNRKEKAPVAEVVVEQVETPHVEAMSKVFSEKFAALEEQREHLKQERANWNASMERDRAAIQMDREGIAAHKRDNDQKIHEANLAAQRDRERILAEANVTKAQAEEKLKSAQKQYDDNNKAAVTYNEMNKKVSDLKIALDQREAALNNRDALIATRENNVASREKLVIQREAEVATREFNVARREKPAGI